MSESLVTIGISFYNSEKTLLDAIKSILEQTFQSKKLVLLN